MELQDEVRGVWQKQIRPHSFEEYPGQSAVKANLKVYVQASRIRQAQLDHVLLHGPPGLGKTTLAQIIAQELEAPLVSTSAPAIEKPGDLAGLLTNLEPGAVLFVDEIHRLGIQCEELLYSAMEDYAIDLLVGAGPTARSVKIDLNPFTLIGATTKISRLSSPLRGRFGIQERLEYYQDQELAMILSRSASILGISLDPPVCLLLGRRSRGTPRVANRLLRRAWDFALIQGKESIDQETLSESLQRLNIDSAGLDRIDRLILKTMAERYRGGPVGIEALAITVGEDRSTIEEVYEPFLVYQGFMARSPRGRVLTEKGEHHVKKMVQEATLVLD
ncbi:MAG: Holliday junction branch migration DNA helicase RuvB [Zetaproteobacteria bacterium]|nr:Holliday junction branch migration DNA helicase RuvB [Zetaproteobacteria bacterium]